MLVKNLTNGSPRKTAFNFPLNIKKHNSYYRLFSLGYIVVFFTSYVFLPFIFLFDKYPQYVTLLIKITFVSIFAFLVGLNISFGRRLKVTVYTYQFNKAVKIVFLIFMILICVIFVTASHIPIIESIKGATSNDLSIYREQFLKDRMGWEVVLGYLISIIDSYILPYFVAVSFLKNHKYKFLFAGIFLLYSISFIEKAYFFKLAIPIFFIYLYKSNNKKLLIAKGVALIIALLMLMYIFSGSTYQGNSGGSFFSITYKPTGIFNNIIWRSLVIPIITAIDGLRVFITQFNGEFFYGKTSSLIAFIQGSERINFERFLYQTQFGGSETGNANQVYLIEAYVNFGYIGIVAFSFVVARLIRSAIKLNDVAVLAILPLFIFNIFNAGLIANLLSNGFLLFFIMARKIKFK
jgi:oligosaccharide repeat unit polymerase